jgi:hypothetical protein
VTLDEWKALIRKEFGPFIDLHCCCNNPDNGSFDGKLKMVELQLPDGDDGLSFDCRFGDAWPAISQKGLHALRVCGVQMFLRGRADWVGNWCWNSYKLTAYDVATLLIHPRFVHWFDVNSGVTELWDAWKTMTAEARRPLEEATNALNDIRKEQA